MKKVIVFLVVIVIIISTIVGGFVLFKNKEEEQNSNAPEEFLKKYFAYIEEENYEEMYKLVNLSDDFSKEDFINRNKNIYQGIDAHNIQITVNSVDENEDKALIDYDVQMSTSAGDVKFSNNATLIKNSEETYKIDWSSNLIFPELDDDYKVRVSRTNSERGNILDRNGNLLAKYGEICNIGIVPGKLEDNKEENIKAVSEILDISVDTIKNEISASWVKDDSFVPIKKISNDNSELKQKLLQIPGIMIDYETDRIYPYKEATSHVTGYVQGITEEELEKMADDGYSSSSVIGKTGIEAQYEDRLRGIDGVKIYIVDDEGNEVKTIKEREMKNGEDIKLTIDINLQLEIYNKMKENNGFFVAMNSKTGEILALVSTPSYDANKFVLGMTNNEWSSIINNEANPLYTRFLGSWCPGSTFKPITGAIGLTSGKISEEDEFSYSGLSWQKDSSWKEHKVTTLTAYNGKKNLRNAIIYSDNIYFAQLALKIGEKTFIEGLKKIDFNKDIDFELSASKSQYSNSEGIASESILADSGYGQGQILVNPIHMASIYSAFVNEGNMIKPYLEYRENKQAEYLVQEAFNKQAANTIKEALIGAVETTGGTGHDVMINGLTIAGKTGTAELKESKEAEGDTLGWFDCFTVDEDIDNSILIVSMVENESSRFLKSIIRELLLNY